MKGLLYRLAMKGVKIMTEVRYEEMTDKGIVITAKEGERKVIEADTIVLAAGAKPNRELFDSLKRKVFDVHFVGDAVEPRRVVDAIADGVRIGCQV